MTRGFLTPNHTNLVKGFRLFLDKIKVHIRINSFSSFARVFQRNWLKFGRYVPVTSFEKGHKALFDFASVSELWPL